MREHIRRSSLPTGGEQSLASLLRNFGKCVFEEEQQRVAVLVAEDGILQRATVGKDWDKGLVAMWIGERFTQLVQSFSCGDWGDEEQKHFSTV